MREKEYVLSQKFLASVLLLLHLFVWHERTSAMPVTTYVRDGDPLRIVWEVGDNESMGIVAEGPLRARCFVIGRKYRELHLYKGSPTKPETLEEFARAIDVSKDEIPDDLITIWRKGYVDWKRFCPGLYFPITENEPVGYFYKLEGTYRLFPLANNRGYILVLYNPGFTRVLRLPPPGKDFIIRPKAGLKEMMDHYDLCESDVCRHLSDIDRGQPVDWAQLACYGL